MSEISDTLLKQRLRNRIIEVLDAFSDEECVEIIGTGEIIEQWYDYVDEERLVFYDRPIFSNEELNALKRFHNLLENSNQKVPETWSLNELLGNKEWESLVSTAKEELQIFQKRGRMDEEQEIT